MAQLSLVLYFLITLMTIIPKSSPAPYYWYHICSNTTMFPSKSRYETNLNTVFHYLSSNATNPYGYHAALAGNGTIDVVYGHFLCRGDQTPSLCEECVSTATNKDLPKTYCPNRKVAIIWYDECMIRYSNESFFGILDQNPAFEAWNARLLTSYSSVSILEIVGNMMNNMVNKTANGGPNKKYATNFAPYSSLQSIYGLEQCAPDLSASDCSQCLENSVGTLQLSYGGRIFAPSCNVRFEDYPFFIGAANLTSPPPPLSPPPLTNNSTGIVPVTSPSSGKSKTSTKVIAIIVPVAVLSSVLLAITFYFNTAKSKKNYFPAYETGEDFTTIESLQYDWATLQSATNNFSDENKLGEGGFGSVYKGILSNGEVVAVKRLSKSSGQGDKEFKNELLLVAKFQHKNLARILGFCLAGHEKLLVYEYAPNKSLDYFIFDPIKQEHVNWGMRYNIIQGIARGMMYLHQDSRLRIIHRDLKASNILLDANMNPKISDFGMARIFGGDQTQSNTSRIVGTFGYMSPEYVMHGQFSTKSDVYSFGVLVLEIISGKRNNSFYELGYAEDLISYAWKLWQEGEPTMLVDTTIRNSCSNHEVTRCMHLGLLCVQDSINARPTIDLVVLSLDSFTVTLPLPRQPAFFSKTVGQSDIGKEMVVVQPSGRNSITPSTNDISVSEMDPR